MGERVYIEVPKELRQDIKALRGALYVTVKEVIPSKHVGVKEAAKRLSSKVSDLSNDKTILRE